MTPPPRIRLDVNSTVPAVHQIVEQIRILLVERQLAPGTQLPAVRRLAIELGVHFNTVAEAYRLLAAEGWLDLKHGRSAVVIERPLADSNESPVTENFRNRLRGIVAQMRSEGISADGIAAELRAIARVVTRT